MKLTRVSCRRLSLASFGMRCRFDVLLNVELSCPRHIQTADVSCLPLHNPLPPHFRFRYTSTLLLFYFFLHCTLSMIPSIHSPSFLQSYICFMLIPPLPLMFIIVFHPLYFFWLFLSFLLLDYYLSLLRSSSTL